MKKLNSLDFLRVLKVCDEDIAIMGLDEEKVIEVEDKMSSTSNKAYFTTFGGMRGFLEQRQDMVDAVFCTKFQVPSMKVLERIVEIKSMRYVLFTPVRTNYSFFDSNILSTLSVPNFLAVLKQRIGLDVFYYEHNNDLYVLIEKN